jgi:hypothetical protein
VKSVRLLRRRIRGKPRCYVPLINEGKTLRAGKVGLDVGPSTVAVVEAQDARLVLFCRLLEEPHRKMRQLPRKLDRHTG